MKANNSLFYRLFKRLYFYITGHPNSIKASFDQSLSLSNIPVAMPNLGEYYEPANEKMCFEVVELKPSENQVLIRETGTDNVYPIDAELFIILFVRSEQIPLDFNQYK
jgi:hypothetical protein